MNPTILEKYWIWIWMYKLYVKCMWKYILYDMNKIETSLDYPVWRRCQFLFISKNNLMMLDAK